MTRLSALLYPETTPAVQNVAALLCFFDTVAYYLPIEQDERQVEPQQQLLHGGLCEGYVPAPLGSDLDRFNHLIRELQTYRSEDITRLVSFAKAEITTGQIRDHDESSAGTLLSAMHKDKDACSSELQVERLWQARLVLKLAEMLDEKETAVKNGLAAVTSIEKKLYGSLQGTGETDPDELASLAGANSGTPGNRYAQHPKNQPLSQADLLIPMRVKAWAELFLADRLRKPASFLATAHKDAAALLIDGCENIFQKQPEKLISLLLPVPPILEGNDEASEKFLNRRSALQSEAHSCLAAIDDFLLETAGLSGTGPRIIKIPAGLDNEVKAWNAAVLSTFPGSTESSRTLDFYCFPAISMEQLFQHLLHLEDQGTPAQHGYSTGITAVLGS
jgi:hypothetical protein